MPTVGAGQTTLAKTAAIYSKEAYQAIFGRDKQDDRALQKDQLKQLEILAVNVAGIAGGFPSAVIAAFPKGR